MVLFSVCDHTWLRYLLLLRNDSSDFSCIYLHTASTISCCVVMFRERRCYTMFNRNDCVYLSQIRLVWWRVKMHDTLSIDRLAGYLVSRPTRASNENHSTGNVRNACNHWACCVSTLRLKTFVERCWKKGKHFVLAIILLIGILRQPRLPSSAITGVE